MVLTVPNFKLRIRELNGPGTIRKDEEDLNFSRQLGFIANWNGRKLLTECQAAICESQEELRCSSIPRRHSDLPIAIEMMEERQRATALAVHLERPIAYIGTWTGQAKS